MQKNSRIIPYSYAKRVADRMGVTPQTISNINKEKTKFQPTIDKAIETYKQLLKEDLEKVEN